MRICLVEKRLFWSCNLWVSGKAIAARLAVRPIRPPPDGIDLAASFRTPAQVTYTPHTRTRARRPGFSLSACRPRRKRRPQLRDQPKARLLGKTSRTHAHTPLRSSSQPPREWRASSERFAGGPISVRSERPRRTETNRPQKQWIHRMRQLLIVGSHLAFVAHSIILPEETKYRDLGLGTGAF